MTGQIISPRGSAVPVYLYSLTGRPLKIVVLVTLFLLPASSAGDSDLVEFKETLQWHAGELEVNFSGSLDNFVYSSASWPVGRHVYECDALFLYYEDDLFQSLAALMGTLNSSDTGIYVVLDPDPPSPGATFLDLYYDRALRLEMIDCIDVIVSELSELGVIGFVLGDEWPRGLNKVEITVDLLSGYNQTYHSEMGLWMRQGAGEDERLSLVEWFYNRSISAWNMVAREIRRRHPGARLGTNIDLVWHGDLSHTNLAHWKPGGWWNQVDLEPYDFAVTHYFTSVDWDDASPAPPSRVEERDLKLLEESLVELQGVIGVDGPEVFLLLGAHCVYPRAKTPMQMIREWNVAMQFHDFLSGVGFFIFDLWISNDGVSIESISIADTIISTPMKMDRLATLRVLLENPLRLVDVPAGSPSNVEVVWRRIYSMDYRQVLGVARSSSSILVASIVRPCSTCRYGVKLLSMDVNGTLIWSGILDYGGMPTSIVEGHDGSYLMAGILNNSKYFIIKLTISGEIVWEKLLDYEHGTPELIWTPWGYATSCGSHLSCLDDDGTVTWQKNLGPLSISCLHSPGNGDLVLGGRSGDDAFVLRLGPGGKHLWYRYLGDWWPLDIAGSPGGFLVSGGETRVCGLECCWLGLRATGMDAEGEVRWNRTLGLWLTDDCSAIHRDGRYTIGWAEGVVHLSWDGSDLGRENLGRGTFLLGGMVDAGDGDLMLAGTYQDLEGVLRIVKLDSYDAVLWDWIIRDDVESCETITGSEGYHAIAGTLTTSSGSAHAYLVELGDDGNPIWDRAYPGGTHLVGAATACDGGGYALAGTYGNCGVFLIRTDSGGELLWESRQCLRGVLDICCVLENVEGHFIMSGTLAGESGGDAFIVSVLPTGKAGWQVTLDSGLDDRAHWLVEGDRCYYLLGDSREEGKEYDILVNLVDWSGRTIWRGVHGGAGKDSATYGLYDGSAVVLAGRGELMGHDGPYLLVIDDGGDVILDRKYQWDGGMIMDMAPSPEGGYVAIGRGGSLLRLDEDWKNIWDTGWEPVGPDASISHSSNGHYLIAGSISGGIRAVKVLEPVAEPPALLLLTVLPHAFLVGGRISSPKAPC